MYPKFDNSKLSLFNIYAMDNCFVISVSVTEDTILDCPLCGDSVKDSGLTKSCAKNNKSHNICVSCYNSLSKTYYEDGIGCLYCGDPRTINKDNNIIDINFNDVVLENNSVIIHNNRGNVYHELTMADIIGYICIPVLSLTLLLALYCFGNLIYSIGVIINHSINNDNHHHGMNFSIKNCIIGILGWLILGYFTAKTLLLINTTYKNCNKNPCIKI